MAYDYLQAAFDGVPLTSFGMILTGQAASEGAPRTSLVDVPGRDGFSDATARPGGWPSLSPMSMTLTLVHEAAGEDVVTADVLALRSSVAGRRVRYEPWDAPRGWWLDCVCTAVSLTSRSARRAEVEVSLACDPAYHGRTVTQSLADGTALAATVGGNRPTWPTLALTASAAGRVSAAERMGGGSVTSAASLAAGAALAINMGARAMTVGGSRAAVTLASDWWRLAPGEASVLVTNAAGTIEWDERWA